MTKTVTLSRSYTSNDKTFSTVELREPTYADVFMSGIGVPRDIQPVAGGGMAFLSYPERFDQYLQRLVVSPGYEHISGVAAIDALKLEEAVYDFFREPADASKSATPSSSGSDGTQIASSE